ncbi:type IX secretion system periplasmic lipoprotein PorW/SprE [Aequorivita viscosa]|uniref:Protein involved in gliding motility SprE n=1 Tax=Aequorivita viscosa TaxID=797419 RepID=A0A1M6MTF6_9FLAO|nr:tetratricopeptide repeat protein [Aequorivita viscosa]SDX37634.1 protein involved in gliding motility SprE [Aequorivita viscosa]SHJ86805.1 protein involved in gliding motility SprE [Aequorivita viscosa]
MKSIYKITLFLLAVVLLAACSRKKNNWKNRNLQAVATEFNTLYNGNVAFDNGKRQLAQGYRDNFWEILPVERIDIQEMEGKAPRASKSGDFNRAEEKAAKAIQKHSMYIDGREYNPQIDEAYMLLGKARYYDGRFIPAMDAFNFILDRYPTSNSINIAKVWKAKTNIRLNNEEFAIENLKKMFAQAELEEEEVADGAAMMVQAYINLDSLPQALDYIKLAVKNTKDKELKGRYTFIQGQLYNRLDKKDSANLAFDKVIEMNRKTSRSYLINAHIEKGRNFDYEKGNRTAFIELLQDLAKDRENRPFLDRIYNQIGQYYQNTDSLTAAVEYYNKSIKAFKQDRILQSVNYKTLAEINFDNAQYKNAGAYYDSTLVFLEKNSREWRRTTKKRENLDDVIKYEDIAVLNDSILNLVAMTDAQQLSYFTEYTSKLRERAVRDSIEAAKDKRKIANNEFFEKGKASAGPGKGSTFYFYNPTTVAYGKGEFRKIWGDRILEDNWRLSSKRSSLESIEEEVKEETPIAENELFNPETYIARIPTDEKVIDSLTKDRDLAYYQLGLIYKEKFKEYELAANRLEKLLTYNPEDRLVVPAAYNLFKIYEILERPADAERYKNNILTNYADTRYAEILRNPNSQLPTDESSPEFKYKQLYKDFEASKYAYVIEQSDEYITIYNGNPIVPKFELLKATAIARQQGFEAYKKALNFVALNYPNSDEGKQAQDIYTTVLPTLENTDFTKGDDSNSWKLVYKFNSAENDEAKKLKDLLDKAIKELNYTNMSTSLDYYTPETQLVIVHGLNSKLGTQGFGEVLRERKGFKIKKPFFEISSPNYKLIQIHKNLDAYLNKEETP